MKKNLNPMSLFVSLLSRGPYFRGKQRIFQCVACYLPFSRARSSYGVVLAKNTNDFTYRAAQLGAYGSFISKFISSLDAPFVFFDVGANQGLFSLIAGKNCACQRVVAIEPNPFIFSFLCQNVKYNDVADKFCLFCAAIGEKGLRCLDLWFKEGHSGSGSIVDAGVTGGLTTKAIALDPSVLNEMRIEGSLSVVKLDVEGAEKIVLDRMAGAGFLEECDYLIIEMSEVQGGPNHSHEIDATLSRLGWAEVDRAGPSHHYDALYKKFGSSGRVVQ